jgi:hypothetical protein
MRRASPFAILWIVLYAAPLCFAAVTIVNLATQVTGILAVANGGTGVATAIANSVFGNATGSSAAPGFTSNPVVTSLSTGSTTCTAGTAGVFCGGEGTASTAASAQDQLYADSTLHDFAIEANGGAAGIVQHTLGSSKQTTQTASIGSTTICAASAGACNQSGLYLVTWHMWGSGTACSSVTAGTVILTLTWHDGAGSVKSIRAPMWVSTSATAGTYVNTGFHFETALTAEDSTGYYVLSSDGTTAIAYSTTYAACTTGTGTYNITIAANRIV